MLSSLRDFVAVTRHFFASSLYILYTADFSYLIRWVIVTYVLLDISVDNFIRLKSLHLVNRRHANGGDI